MREIYFIFCVLDLCICVVYLYYFFVFGHVWYLVWWTCIFVLCLDMFWYLCCAFIKMCYPFMTWVPFGMDMSIVDYHLLFNICYIYLCLSMIFFYACVKGELHLKSLPKIFVITIYVLSSSKRGRLLAQRSLAQYPDEYFDDNKPYLVMYLTILFKRISGSKQVDLTAPLSRLTSLDAAKDLHS